jgi:mannose-6-phosphate isomerase-like protein (cupin superfamily)
MTRPQATPVVHIDDDRFKATEWRIATGAETGWHVHGHDYVIVPLTDGTLVLEEPGGAGREAALRRHVPYSRRTGVEHNVVNGGEVPLAFLEGEVVDDALGRAREAVLERFMAALEAATWKRSWPAWPRTAPFTPPRPRGLGQAARGPDAVRAAYRASSRLSRGCLAGRQARGAGDLGVSSWRFVGTDRDGRRVDVEGCDLFAFEGELIALKDSFRKARTS